MKNIVDRYWINLPVSKERNKKWKTRKTKELTEYYLSAKENYKEVLAIEEAFSHIDNCMIIKGKVDLIIRNNDNEVCLKDFKARKKKGIEKTNVDKQLRMYNYCLGSEYNIDRLIAHTTEDNQETHFEPANEDIRKFLKEMADKIKEENYHKQKNEFCPYCQFNFYCKEEK
jgi:DNA helicase-2/ATP-dependent DNA helicase PcrA